MLVCLLLLCAAMTLIIIFLLPNQSLRLLLQISIRFVVLPLFLQI